MYATTAAEVRTGQVIRTPWSSRYASLEVETVTHQTFRNPEGVTMECVRFTGWELFMGKPVMNDDGTRRYRVTRGWGTRNHEQIKVVDDLRMDRYDFLLKFGSTADYDPETAGGPDRAPYLPLSGRADGDRLAAELAEFLAGAAVAA
jgi:hypothetical protein